MQILILKRRHYNEVKMSMQQPFFHFNLEGLREKRRKINGVFLFFLFFQNTEGNIKSNYKYEILLHMQNLKLNQDFNCVDHIFF